jgi:putative transcriptional regulator
VFSEWQSFLLYAGLFSISGTLGMDNRIKEFRARYDLTQDDLAQKVGVRRETIVFLEKGKYNPSLKLAHDIADVFKVTIEEVFIFEK